MIAPSMYNSVEIYSKLIVKKVVTTTVIQSMIDSDRTHDF